MDEFSEDLALIKKAAKLAKYPVLGVTRSTDTGGVKVVRCAVLIRTGDESCTQWNPITSEKDLYGWIQDIGQHPFHHGFVAPIMVGFTLGLPDDYEPTLGPYKDKQEHSRRLVSAFVGVLSESEK